MDGSWLIIERVSFVLGIIGSIAGVVQILIWLRHIWREDDRKRKLWKNIKKSHVFLVILVVFVTSFIIYGVAKTYECYQGNCPSVSVCSYRDFHLDNVTVNKELDKAIIYGSMSKNVCVPNGKTRLIVEITIPSNGWGEGLAGPEGSSAEIKVDSQVKYERIAADQKHYHHGLYYKYEYGDHFSSTFDVTGKDNVVLAISVVSGARMDFKQVALTFE